MELFLELIGYEVDFESALAHLKKGGKASRETWRNRAAADLKWIRLVEPEGTSDFDYGMKNMPYLELKTENSTLVPWVATQEDLLAEDWMLLEDMEE